MKRRRHNRQLKPPSALPSPRADADQKPTTPSSPPRAYNAPVVDPSILNHSSQEVIQDAGPKPLSAARLTPAAIPEVLTLLQQLYEQLEPSSERGRSETEATDAGRGGAGPPHDCGSGSPSCDSPAPRSSAHREAREAPEADD